MLAGSSFVAAALGFFAQSIVDDRDNWYTNELQRIAHDQFCEKHKDNIFLLVKGEAFHVFIEIPCCNFFGRLDSLQC